MICNQSKLQSSQLTSNNAKIINTLASLHHITQKITSQQLFNIKNARQFFSQLSSLCTFDLLAKQNFRYYGDIVHKICLVFNMIIKYSEKYKSEQYVIYCMILDSFYVLSIDCMMLRQLSKQKKGIKGVIGGDMKGFKYSKHLCMLLNQIMSIFWEEIIITEQNSRYEYGQFQLFLYNLTILNSKLQMNCKQKLSKIFSIIHNRVHHLKIAISSLTEKILTFNQILIDHKNSENQMAINKFLAVVSQCQFQINQQQFSQHSYASSNTKIILKKSRFCVLSENSWTNTDEIEKTMCAIMNQGGGYMIVGAKKPAQKFYYTVQGIKMDENNRQQIIENFQKCYKYIQPRQQSSMVIHFLPIFHNLFDYLQKNSQMQYVINKDLEIPGMFLIRVYFSSLNPKKVYFCSYKGSKGKNQSLYKIYKLDQNSDPIEIKNTQLYQLITEKLHSKPSIQNLKPKSPSIFYEKLKNCLPENNQIKLKEKQSNYTFISFKITQQNIIQDLNKVLQKEKVKYNIIKLFADQFVETTKSRWVIQHEQDYQMIYKIIIDYDNQKKIDIKSISKIVQLSKLTNSENKQFLELIQRLRKKYQDGGTEYNEQSIQVIKVSGLLLKNSNKGIGANKKIKILSPVIVTEDSICIKFPKYQHCLYTLYVCDAYKSIRLECISEDVFSMAQNQQLLTLLFQIKIAKSN